MKLLGKTIRAYSAFSFTIFLVTIPLFYFVVRSVLLHAVDKSLRTQLRDIRSNLSSLHSQEDLAIWSKLDKDILLAPTDREMPDHVHTAYRYNKRNAEQEPYREIEGTIHFDGKMYKLIISSSLVENEDLLGSILAVQAILLVLLMAGMLWINQKISKKLWQPFYTALGNIQQFELNKQADLPFKNSDTDEFNELNKAIRNLFSRSYEIYLQQKEFTENASHEMQTPLAIFQNQLELLMQTSPLTEEQALLIHSLETTNRRIIRLNKSLLLLAKIENNQYQSVEEVNIAQLTGRLVEQYQAHADEKGISISEKYSGAPLQGVNVMLMEILLGNLLANAIRHNVHNGAITVTVDDHSVAIQNNGVAGPLNIEKVFDRFHKQNSSPEATDSTGLGLAIVKKICALYRYRIHYSFQEDLHTFKIIFEDPGTGI